MPSLRSPRSLLPILFLLLVPACALPGEGRPGNRYSIEEFLGTTNYRVGSFSPDGTRILVSSDETGVFNAVAIPVAGGPPEPLTHSTTDAVLVHSYFPEDERFLYSSDQGGNELTHLYVRERDGSVVDLTPGERLKAQFLGWAKDEKSFFASTNERDPRFFDVYEIAVDGYARTKIFQDDVGYDLGAISPDKRTLALHKVRTRADSDIFLHDRETGETRLLTPHEGNVNHEPQTFSPDGSALYFLTDEGSEFLHLVRVDLANGRRETVEKPPWDVRIAAFSRTGKHLVVAVDHDARLDLRVVEAATGRRVRLPRFPEAEITSVTFSRDEKKVVFTASGSRHPGDLYLFGLGTPEAHPIAKGLNPAIDARDLVEGRVVRFASTDGLTIPGILYKPHGASARARAPALVWVHGGPGGQSRVGYNPLLQYLVNHGYVVYAINNRGSSGYGKTFYRLDDRLHGRADLDDCVASKKMLVDTGFVDPQRIGILGGSYGGYMVLAALAFRPDAFGVGIDIFGVANWVRTLESIPAWWESFRASLYEEMGDPAVDLEMLRAISPLFHAERIRKPLLVLQGANDPRVLKVESDEIVEAVRRNGVPVEYVVFDDEGHGFRKKANQERGYSAVLGFLDVHLKGAAEP